MSLQAISQVRAAMSVLRDQERFRYPVSHLFLG
jgi:hypothetical protein